MCILICGVCAPPPTPAQTCACAASCCPLSHHAAAADGSVGNGRVGDEPVEADERVDDVHDVVDRDLDEVVLDVAREFEGVAGGTREGRGGEPHLPEGLDALVDLEAGPDRLRGALAARGAGAAAPRGGGRAALGARVVGARFVAESDVDDAVTLTSSDAVADRAVPGEAEVHARVLLHEAAAVCVQERLDGLAVRRIVPDADDERVPVRGDE